jgi:hypothetical protein
MGDQLYAFMFRGLLSEVALDLAGRQTRLSRSGVNEAISRSVALDLIDPDSVARAQRMAPAYTAIAAFEISLREFVARRLLEYKGENWWPECVSEKIRQKAESRREEEAKIRWHAPRGDDPLNYTEFGDLTAIISRNWDQFEAHMRSQEWVRHIVGTLERSRNVIMHSGELTSVDFERIGTVIRDWVRQVGS